MADQAVMNEVIAKAVVEATRAAIQTNGGVAPKT